MLLACKASLGVRLGTTRSTLSALGFVPALSRAGRVERDQ